MTGSFKERAYNECLCKYCARSGTGWRRFVKRHTRRIDRRHGRYHIQEQLQDLEVFLPGWNQLL